MSNEIKVHSAWHYKLEDENYAVVNIFVDDNQNTVICTHSLDTGYYDEGIYMRFTGILHLYQRKVYERIRKKLGCRAK